MGGVYDIPAIFMAVRGVFTNTVPIDAYRGAGKPEANYMIERLVEAAARRLGLDPVELRRRNLIAAFPHRSGDGHARSIAGGFVANLDDAVARADRAGFAARRAEREGARQAARARHRLLPRDLARRAGRGRRDPLRDRRHGRRSRSAPQSNGQGHETSFAQIAADRLGAADRGVPLRPGRHARGQERQRAWRRALDAYGRRGAACRRSTVLSPRAARSPRHLLQAERGRARVSPTDGFTVRGSERGIDLLALARAARDPANLPDGIGPGLDADVLNTADVFTFPNGCHVAEVEIDPETGAVDARALHRGRRLRPADQSDADRWARCRAALAQGIGQALLEHTVYDPELGPAAERLASWTTRCRAPTICRPLDITLVERADRGQPARRQGLGPGRLHRRAADHHRRHPRCARAARRRAHRHAGDPRARLARDPGSAAARSVEPLPSAAAAWRARSFAGARHAACGAVDGLGDLVGDLERVGAVRRRRATWPRPLPSLL